MYLLIVLLRKNLIQIYIKDVAPWSTRQEMAPKLRKSSMYMILVKLKKFYSDFESMYYGSAFYLLGELIDGFGVCSS